MPFTPSLFEPAAKLAAAVFGQTVEADPYASWHWRLLDNPAANLNEDLGWICQTESGQIVGLLANVPQLFWAENQVVLACACSTYVVDPTHRLQGLALARAFFRQKKPVLLLNTTANRAAREIFWHFGAHELPAWDEVFFWVLRPLSFVASVLRRSQRASMLAKPVTSLSRVPLMRDIAFRRGWPIQPKGITVEPVTRIDNAFDALWDRLREEHAVTAVRTAHVLSWRFHGSPSGDRRCNVLAARDNRGRLLGYLAWRRFDMPEIGLTRARIVDIFAPVGRPEVMDALLRGTLLAARADGASVLEIQHVSKQVRHHLMQRGALRRRTESGGYLFEWNHNDYAARGANNWYPSAIDGDSAM